MMATITGDKGKRPVEGTLNPDEENEHLPKEAPPTALNDALPKTLPLASAAPLQFGSSTDSPLVPGGEALESLKQLEARMKAFEGTQIHGGTNPSDL